MNIQFSVTAIII